MEGYDRRVRQRVEEHAIPHDADVPAAEESDDDTVEVWDEHDVLMDALPFGPYDELVLQRENDRNHALQLATAILRGLEPSIGALLRLVQAKPDGVHLFAMNVQGSTLFGLCLRALPTRKLRSLLFDLETRYPTLWTMQLGEVHQTLLHLATRERPTLYVLRIIAANDQAKLIADRYDSLPIHEACTSPTFTIDFLAAILDTRGEGLRHLDGDRRLPLHLALCNVARGHARVEQIHAIRWMIELYPQAQRMVDGKNMTPVMAALDKFARRASPPCYRAWALLEELVDETPGSLRATRLEDGVQHVLSTALHVVAESWFLSKRILRFVLAHDIESTQCQDFTGELPLHKMCRRFADFDGENDILHMIYIILNAYPDGLHCRNLDGLTPLHHAITSWEESSVPAVNPPAKELLRFIKMATSATVRGSDRRLDGRETSASCLQYAYECCPLPEILFALYELSPIEILLMNGDFVRFNCFRDFETRRSMAFLVLMEIILHPTFIEQTLSLLIRNVLQNFFPDVAEDSARSITCMLSQEPLWRDLRAIREMLLNENDVRNLLFYDFGPGEGRLGEMVRALWRANFGENRVHRPMQVLTKDDHCVVLSAMSDNASATYLHLRDCLDVLFEHNRMPKEIAVSGVELEIQRKIFDT